MPSQLVDRSVARRRSRSWGMTVVVPQPMLTSESSSVRSARLVAAAAILRDVRHELQGGLAGCCSRCSSSAWQSVAAANPPSAFLSSHFCSAFALLSTNFRRRFRDRPLALHGSALAVPSAPLA